jgi:hypothetical protein
MVNTGLVVAFVSYHADSYIFGWSVFYARGVDLIRCSLLRTVSDIAYRNGESHLRFLVRTTILFRIVLGEPKLGQAVTRLRFESGPGQTQSYQGQNLGAIWRFSKAAGLPWVIFGAQRAGFFRA